MRLLGIDPGLYITGYGIVNAQNKSEIVLVEAGVIKTSKNDILPQRLLQIYSQVLEIIEEFKPQALILENLYSHYKYPAAVIPLAYVRGVICLLCGQKNIPLYNYSATRMKKALIGKGRATKEQIKKMVAKFFNVSDSIKYADATDALALVLVHCRLHLQVF